MYRNFFGISPGYHISQKIENFYVLEFFWDIPGISHIPKNMKFLCTGFFMVYPWDIPYPEKPTISMYRFLFGISHIPMFFKTMYRERKIEPGCVAKSSKKSILIWSLNVTGGVAD